MTLDIAYANADFIDGAMDYPPRWAEKASVLRARQVALGGARLGLKYGDGARQTLDLFLPDVPPLGVMVFVHGGYWRAFSGQDWSHAAAGALARGWAAAIPTYTLAPGARIAEITGEIARAISLVAQNVPGPIVLAGHSAGGHLVARMNCRDVALTDDVVARIRRIVPISPVSDLRPLMRIALNADFRLDAAEATAESPLLHDRRRAIPTIVWVGAEERPVFLDQARWLAEAWDEATLRIAPGRHHFDVVEDLELPDAPLTRAMFDQI